MTGLATTDVVVKGTIVFILFWMLITFTKVPFLPIGRTAGSNLAAILMIVLGVLTTTEAMEAIDLFTLITNSSVVTLIRVCVFSSVMAAFFTNDTACVVLTPLLLGVCDRYNLPYQPFLMAVATSTSILF
eukprot:Pgem_evm1s10931